MCEYKLAAFDFDHTIIDVNSDTFIDRILLRLTNSEKKSYPYPDDIENLNKTLNWTHRMNGVFSYMNTKYSIKRDHLINCLHEIQITDSMKQVLTRLKQDSFDLIIVSDANSVFIEEILKKNDLLHLFSNIYTNKAEFCTQTDCLKVVPLNESFNPDKQIFKCPTQICQSNICKGEILNHHLKHFSNGSANKIVYVGDGYNDYCPGLSLQEKDFYFVRLNHSLSKLLAKRADLANKIKCKIYNWTTADDILTRL